MEVSKHLVAILNVITFLLAIPVLGAGIWLAGQRHTDCVSFLQGPVIAVGVFMLLISVAGFVGAYLRITWLLWVYLLVMFLLIVLLFCFTVFSFAVTNYKGAGQAMAGVGYKDYRLSDYSGWLQRRVESPGNWRKIRSCVESGGVCESLGVYKSATEFYKAQLSAVQSGCCKPPTSCNYLFLNATYWARPLNEDADPDCHVYSYVQTELCWECAACRAGVAEGVRRHWRRVALVNIVVFFLLIVVYAAGCHTFHRAQDQGRYARYGKGFF